MNTRTVETYNRPEGVKKYHETSQIFWNKGFPREIYDKFARLVPLQTNSVGRDIKLVLDVGSGTGAAAQKLGRYGLEVVCIDAAPNMARFSQQSGITSVAGDMLHLPILDGSVGGVWEFKSLVHAARDEFPQGLSEARRVLMDCGVFALGMIEGRGTRNSYLSGRKRKNTYYTMGEVTSHMRDAGFDVFYRQRLPWLNSVYLILLGRKI